MKSDNLKWLVPLISFVIYECWLYIIYLISYSPHQEMKGLIFGLFLLGYLGIVLVILGYLFIPVTQYFYKKGVDVVSLFIAIICLLPPFLSSCLLFKGRDLGIAFLVFLQILSGFNIPYFLMLILIFKDRRNEISDK